MNFKEWLLKEAQEGSKTGLYPMGYGGIGLYPPQTYLTKSADAIYYFTMDERIYKSKDSGQFDITHLLPKSKETMNSGDGGLWNISKLKGKPSHKQGQDMAANDGEGGIWDIRGI